MSRTANNFLLWNVWIWTSGWFSLGLVETGFRFILSPSPLVVMGFSTLALYALSGMVLGLLYGIIAFFIQPHCKGLKAIYSPIHFSMAACVAAIISLYALLFFFKVSLYENTPLTFLKGVLLFNLIIAILFLLPLFFYWMDGRGNLYIAYFSFLPPLWMFTSLKLNRSKELLPSLLQVSTFPHILLLTLAALICFFLLYLVFLLSRRLFNAWKGDPLFKASLVILPFVLLCLILFFSLKREGYPGNRGKIKASVSQPNIILITLDTLRADHVSSYGYERETTPNLDAFSREAVVYKNAYATAAWTLPSHASIFTGLYPTKHGAYFSSEVRENGSTEVREKGRNDFGIIFGYYILGLSDGHRTWAEILSDAGYSTAGIIGGPFCSAAFGLGQGFDYYDENFLGVDKDIEYFLIYQVMDLFIPLKDIAVQYGYSNTKRLASHLNEAAFRWLEENYRQPFFLFINYFDPHNPYLPPPPYDAYFGKVERKILVKPNRARDRSLKTAEFDLILSVLNGSHRLTAAERDLVVSLYDGEIRYLDHYLGQLFDKLKALGVYDNTLIMVTSDHGEAFGEHNQMDHGRTLYDVLLRVPLIIKYPSSAPEQGVVEKRVSLVDLMPTALSFLGYPIPAGIDGEVLTAPERPIIAEWHPKWFEIEKYRRELRAVYQGNEKYIWAANNLHELYNLAHDPGEEENLMARFPERAEALQKILEQWLASFKPLAARGETVKIDKSTEEKLRALGYVR